MNEDGQSCDIIGKFISFIIYIFSYIINIVFSVTIPNYEQIKSSNRKLL